MPVKLRLARHGKKGKPFYYIVAADSRAPRDGRYIERVGSYNPNTNPAIIDLNFDKALEWVQNGAQPTDTVRAILSYKGVLYKYHLQGGVKKGAFSEEEADRRFEIWMNEKLAKIQAKRDKLSDEAKAAMEKRLAAERKISDERAAEIAKKNSELAEEAASSEATEGEEAAAEEAPAEENVATDA